MPNSTPAPGHFYTSNNSYSVQTEGSSSSNFSGPSHAGSAHFGCSATPASSTTFSTGIPSISPAQCHQIMGNLHVGNSQ